MSKVEHQFPPNPFQYTTESIACIWPNRVMFKKASPMISSRMLRFLAISFQKR